ncbi:MAG: hypothetical protein H6637_01120 [Ardenticatenales bacterium]|nr:hypothetical protein [Ardenticatenales bacterium]
MPDNDLEADAATLKAIYDNSLILLYRLLFVLFAESRGLLPAQPSSAYYSYSLARLKRTVARQGQPAARRRQPHHPLERAARVVEHHQQGDAALGVPAYNGGLFSPTKHPFYSSTGSATATSAARSTCWRGRPIRRAASAASSITAIWRCATSGQFEDCWSLRSRSRMASRAAE